jgi:hypothetical protein
MHATHEIARAPRCAREKWSTQKILGEERRVR